MLQHTQNALSIDAAVGKQGTHHLVHNVVSVTSQAQWVDVTYNLSFFVRFSWFSGVYDVWWCRLQVFLWMPSLV